MMNIHPGYVGIDISKLYLDVCFSDSDRPERFDNTPDTARMLAARFAASGDWVVFEATGIYDRFLRRALNEVSVAYSRVNPSQARAFARAAGFLAKTDQVDARMLRAMGRALSLRQDQTPEPDREQLGRLHKRRDQLVLMRAQERNRLKEWVEEDMALEVDEHLEWLDGQIRRLDLRIRELIRSNETLAKLERQLRSVPGIGPIAAATLIALVPEMGSRSPKTIAALVGLAPYNADSGAKRGKRSIRGGRKRVRDALYMAAVAAARSDTRFGRFYQSLRKAGKPHKVAFIAVARKLLTTANAMVRDNAQFQT